jgi:hypothetical protein
MRTMLLLLASLALPAVSNSAIAQTPIKAPQLSPAAKVSLAIGPTMVDIVYHRPGVKGRAIWGGLVPYGEVWRAGANEATTIQFSDDVKVAGHDVPKGTYSFFAIPTEKSWTLILNKTADQWGAFKYNAADDLLRFEVKPAAAPMLEWMRYTIEPKSENAAVVQLAWEKLAVEFTVEVDIDKIMTGQIDAAIASAKPDDAATFYTAAKYYFDHNLANDKAVAWVDKSIAIKDGYRARELKARLADRTGKKTEAVAELEKAVTLAEGGKAQKPYIDGLKKLLVEYKAKS